ncbi:hypothetical protein CAPTEDRAFT_82789, partial [Capitella teleta]
IVGTVAVLCYMNAMHGDFVHDDLKAIVSNADVTGEVAVAEVFVHDFWGSDIRSNTSHKSYRPLTTLTFRATHAVFGLHPLAFHVVNVALHVIVTSLLHMFMREIDKASREGALAASLLFAVHPIHTEAVTGLVGRADVLCAAFFLSCLMAYMQAIRPNTRSRNGWLLVSVLMATGSMLSKEHGITSLALCGLIEVTDKIRSLYAQWEEVACSLLAEAVLSRILCDHSQGALLVWCRWWLMGEKLPTFTEQDNPAAFHPNCITRILTRLYVYSLNLRLLVFPSQLSHDWSANSIALVHSIFDVRNWQTLFAFGIVSCVAWAASKEAVYKRQPSLLLSLGVLVLPFIPASGLLFTVGFVLAERVLYIPRHAQPGFCALFGCALSRVNIVSSKQKLVFLITLCSLFGVKTVLRNRAWQNRDSLIRSGLHVLPHNAKLHYNFGNLLKDTERPIEAMNHYEKAIKYWPEYPSAHNNLGTLLSSMDASLAEQHFRSAVKQASCHSNALFNLG